MKKLIALAMAGVMALGMLAGCGNGNAAPTATAAPAATNAPASNETAAPASDGGKIVIGGINDLTGSRSVTGNAINNGVLMAVEEINAAGGILGKQIDYVVYDNKNDGVRRPSTPTPVWPTWTRLPPSSPPMPAASS